MNLILYMMMSIFMLTLLILTLAFILSKKTLMNREKNSPFECGFDPKSETRMPFSLRFFLIAVIFLIFDVEIALMLPLPLILSFSETKTFLLLASYFILILISGLYYEWQYGVLNWFN